MPDAARSFDGLVVSHRRERVRWIEEAKMDETRTRRLDAALEALLAGRRTR